MTYVKLNHGTMCIHKPEIPYFKLEDPRVYGQSWEQHKKRIDEFLEEAYAAWDVLKPEVEKTDAQGFPRFFYGVKPFAYREKILHIIEADFSLLNEMTFRARFDKNEHTRERCKKILNARLKYGTDIIDDNFRSFIIYNDDLISPDDLIGILKNDKRVDEKVLRHFLSLEYEKNHKKIYRTACEQLIKRGYEHRFGLFRLLTLFD